LYSDDTDIDYPPFLYGQKHPDKTVYRPDKI